MVDYPHGVAVHEREGAEMVRKTEKNADVWDNLDKLLTPAGVRLDVPIQGMSRLSMRRIGELMKGAGEQIEGLTHNASLRDADVARLAASVIQGLQAMILPERRKLWRKNRADAENGR